jgi:hypothetical protein
LNGVVYFNVGRKCLYRLIVSIYSLRKVYSGPISLLYTEEEQKEYNIISKTFDVNIVKNKITAETGKNAVYLEKCLTHLNSPFENTLWLDSDTIILKDPTTEMWENSEKYEFAICPLANWKSNGKKIKDRIETWKNVYPEFIEAAINFGPAINCGVLSFNKSSKLMKDWYSLAVKNREAFIPDEVCCQIILPRYKHQIMSEIYNTSCKYSKLTEDTKVIHFHGRKHCRIDENGKLLFMGEVWVKFYKECVEKNICEINKLENVSDRMLKRYFKK